MKTILKFLLIVLIMWPIYGQSQEQPPPSTQGQPREKSVKNTAASNITSTNQNNKSDITVSQVIKREAPYSDQATQKSNDRKATENTPNGWDNWTADPVKVFTACLIVCNVFLFLIQICLWLSTKKAADAAKRSADSLSIIERAYIFPKVSGKSEYHSEGQQRYHTIDVKIANFGKTPAFLTNLLADVHWDDPIPKSNITLPKVFLVPNKSINPDIPFNPMMDESTKTLAKKLLCRGIIEYRDIWMKGHKMSFSAEGNWNDASRCFDFSNTQIVDYT